LHGETGYQVGLIMRPIAVFGYQKILKME